MIPSDDTIAALREALAVSPDNIPLHQHLAESLLKLGRFDEAEAAYREALAVAPHHVDLKLGLAGAFYQQQKNSAALVIVEDLIEAARPAGRRVRAARQAAAPRRRAAARRPSVPRGARHRPRRGRRRTGPRARRRPPTRRRLVDDDEDVDGRIRQRAGELPPGPQEFDVERPTITFDDVGGMDAVKEEIRMKIIHPLEHPELYKAYGKTIGGGILMYGPPGCGKTYLARATAGEIKAGFLAVGINDVLDMWIGNSEKNLHELFEQARRNKPCVLFFDEVDALGASRADMRHSGGRHLINQFLSELDGVAVVERRRADPRRDQRPVAPRPRLPPPGPVRPHPVRPAAGSAGPRRDPAADARGQAGRRRRLRRSSPRRPTASPAPTSRRSSTSPSRPSSATR